MDKSKYCRLTEEHRLYRAIGCECPCYKEMLIKRKKRVAQHKAQNPGYGIRGIKVQRSSSYTPAKNKPDITV